MEYEVEFHAVGDGTKAGDAITIRYCVNGRYEVMVVDGGTQDCAETIVEHIKHFYGPDTIIAHVVSTHPDTDHASGLREIMRNFPVQNLWVHGLWYHAAELAPYFAGSWSENDLSDEIRGKYPIIEELIDTAVANGTAVWEPFQGARIGPFLVLSPTKHAYLRLVSQFRKTPEANKELLEAENWWLEVEKQSFLSSILEKAASVAAKWVPEFWDFELLKEGAVTAAENETSTVLFGTFGTHTVLLTADAGFNALHWASDYAAASGYDLSAVTLVQVPHHGSRSNVTPSILDKLLGPKLPAGSAPVRTAVVSCPKDDEKHPRKMVVNAFRRRGCFVGKTQGSYFRRFSGMPARPSEVQAVGFEWFSQVEDYD